MIKSQTFCGFPSGLSAHPDCSLKTYTMKNAAALKPPRDREDLVITIIGTGIGGLCMAVKLLKAGFKRIIIVEKAASVGGTWRENTYPGVACDIPSHLYSFTFFRNPNWSQMFAPGREIRTYLEKVAAHFGLNRLIKFNKEIVKATYIDNQWQLETQDGEQLQTHVLIAATGFLHIPKLPKIPGLDSFEGRQFHSARWDHGVDLRQKRVGIVGNGSSAAQIVPKIGGEVARLSVFQRTPQWIFPMPNEQYSVWRRMLWKIFPHLTMKLYRAMLAQFNMGFGLAVVGAEDQLQLFRTGCEQYLASIEDPQLRDKLRPAYEVACKRLVFSDKFYEALRKPNCELITDPIRQIEATGVRTSDGELTDCDVLILATGFQSHQYFRSIALTGESGLSLQEAWATGAKSFEAVALAGFPNFFMVGGPFSTVGNLSFVTCAELEADYIVELVRKLLVEHAAAIVPTPEAQRRFMDDVLANGKKTVWQSGCDSWYLDEHGNVSIWTKTPEQFFEMMKKGPRPQDYRLVN